jgi:hypothetical protein
MFLQNVRELLPDYTVQYPRGPELWNTEAEEATTLSLVCISDHTIIILYTFMHSRMTVTSQNLIQEEIKKLNSGNACCHSVQNLLSSRLLSKKLEYTKL